MVGFDLKLLGQLPIDRLDDLAHLIDQPSQRRWELLVLIGARQRQQPNLPGDPQLRGQGGTDVPFIAQHQQVMLVVQQIASGLALPGVGRRQFKVDNHAADRDQQMQAIAVDGLFFGGAATNAAVWHESGV